MRNHRTNVDIAVRYKRSVENKLIKIKKDRFVSFLNRNKNVGIESVEHNIPKFEIRSSDGENVDLNVLEFQLKMDGGFASNNFFEINFQDVHKWFRSMIETFEEEDLISATMIAIDEHGNKVISVYDMQDFFLVFADVSLSRSLSGFEL